MFKCHNDLPVLQLHLELLHLGLQLVLDGPMATTQLVQVRASPPHLDEHCKCQMALPRSRSRSMWCPKESSFTSFSLFSNSSFSISMIFLSRSLSEKSEPQKCGQPHLFFLWNSSSSFRSFSRSNSFSRRWSSEPR